MVAANPGDWGIDVFIGNLGGLVTVWQSKYFFPVVSTAHQSQIRESFKSATENAAKQGFKLSAVDPLRAGEHGRAYREVVGWVEAEASTGYGGRD